MPRFASVDGIEIAYQEWGAESRATLASPASRLPAVFLHHGFIANANLNWVGPGVVEALVRAGRHVVVLDARGHGASGKPRDPSYYGEAKMAADLRLLFDRISGQEQVDLVGYSMGAAVSLLTASRDARVRRLVAGGVGAGLVEREGPSARGAARGAIIDALRASDASSIQDPIAVRFRRLADVVGTDREAREALAACAEASFSSSIPFAQVSAPTLVLVGEEDPIAARPEVLAAALPHAQLRLISGDHLSAVTNPAFAPAIVDFLGEA